MPQSVRLRCRVTGSEFTVSALEQELCRKLALPLPTISPLERLRQLASFSNYINLHFRRCSRSGERILSTFRPSTPFPVYANQVWWSDEWEALDFGRPYDFSRPFFDQYRELLHAVPQPALSVTTTTVENCDYINGASFCRNCYLLVHGYYSEDCYFCFGAFRSRDCVDCSGVYDCELCYDCSQVINGYDLRHSFNCKGCRDSAFLWNCVGCEHCYGCVNLFQGRYCYYNEQLSRERFEERLAALEWDNAEMMEDEREKFMAFVKRQPQPAIRGMELENVSGDFLSYCRNVENCFSCKELEDCVNCINVEKVNDCVDMFGFGNNCELIGRSARCGYNSRNVKLSALGYLDAADLEYCFMCPSSRSCFGCVSLQHQERCILNKQYRPDEYRELRKRILAQMREDGKRNAAYAYGEIFPYALSPFPFNDSDAQLFYPLERNEAERRGGRWEDDDEAAQPTRRAALPKRTRDATSIDGACVCRTTGKPYVITEQELRVYRRRNLPLPLEHWRTRLLKRHALRNDPVLYEHVCALSRVKIHSSFRPNDGWTLYAQPEFSRVFGG